MTKVLTDNANYTGIAGAIRSKLGVQTTYTPAQMAAAIGSIPTGGGDDPFALTDYIESSGTQYINTGYEPNNNSKFEVIANVPDNSTPYPAIFGERTYSANGVVLFAEYNANGLSMQCANGDSVTPLPQNRFHIGAKTRYVLGANGKIEAYTADGLGFSFVIAAGSFATLPIYLFVLNDNGSVNSVTWCSMKLYCFRVYEDDALVMELLPYEDNGEACLRDSVTGNLYKNAGTGVFTFGADE